jgi:hypothetical protein
MEKRTMIKTAEELKAELAALEAKPTGTPVQPIPTPAPMKRRFTEIENSNLTWMRNTIAELSRESKAYIAAQEGQQPTAPEAEPEPVTESRRERAISSDDYFAFQQWKITREAEGQPSSVADWIAETCA